MGMAFMFSSTVASWFLSTAQWVDPEGVDVWIRAQCSAATRSAALATSMSAAATVIHDAVTTIGAIVNLAAILVALFVFRYQVTAFLDAAVGGAIFWIANRRHAEPPASRLASSPYATPVRGEFKANTPGRPTGDADGDTDSVVVNHASQAIEAWKEMAADLRVRVAAMENAKSQAEAKLAVVTQQLNEATAIADSAVRRAAELETTLSEQQQRYATVMDYVQVLEQHASSVR